MALKIKTKTKKLPCRYCGKKTGIIKFYILADDLEAPPAPYHPICMALLLSEVNEKL